MKITKINTHCEFNTFTGCTDHYMYYYFEDGSKLRIDGTTKWPNEFAEKLGVTQEYEDMIIAWHRYIQAFTEGIAREYAKKLSPYEEDNESTRTNRRA
jgi:hypothetical protein